MKRPLDDVHQHQGTRKKQTTGHTSNINNSITIVNKKRRFESTSPIKGEEYNGNVSEQLIHLYREKNERAVCKRQLERRFLNRGYFFNEDIEYIC